MSKIGTHLLQIHSMDVIGQAHNHGHVALMQADVVYQRDTVEMILSAILVLSVKLVDVLNGFHQMLSAAPNHNVSQMIIKNVVSKNKI